jgi:hypothetical protein
MAELERRLDDLRAHLVLPSPEPSADAVVGRLGEPRTRRRLPLLVLAVVAAAAAVLAVPPARSALLELFGIGGIEIRRVDELPVARRRAPIAFGAPVSVQTAQERVDFPVLYPKALGPPDAVFVTDSDPGGRVDLVWGSRTAPRALLTSFLSTGIIGVKAIAARTVVEPVHVHGAAGTWISGPDHAFTYTDRDGVNRLDTSRLVGNVLIWKRGRITYRLEARITKTEALELASDLVRP